jgi:glutathione S-transferase
MSELQILGAPQSNYVWLARIVCVEKGVPYTLVPAMPHSPEIDAIHPVGKIPALRHGEVSLAESRAICFYIDKAFDGPSLMPADVVAAARTEQWISIVNTHVDPLLVRQYLGGYIFPRTPDGSPDRKRIDATLEGMERQFDMLETAVARGGGGLVNETFTLADANLLPILYYLSKMPESGAMFGRSKRLQAYFELHMQRPSVVATLPPPLSSLRQNAA